jgi:hypothetical protein
MSVRGSMIGRGQTFSVRICSSILSDIWRAASSSRSRCMRSSGVSSCGGAIARESGSSSKLRPMAYGKRGEGREEKGRVQAQPGTALVGSADPHAAVVGGGKGSCSAPPMATSGGGLDQPSLIHELLSRILALSRSSRARRDAPASSSMTAPMILPQVAATPGTDRTNSHHVILPVYTTPPMKLQQNIPRGIPPSVVIAPGDLQGVSARMCPSTPTAATSVLALLVVLLLRLRGVRRVRVLARDDLDLGAGDEVVVDLELRVAEVERPDLVARVVRVQPGLRRGAGYVGSAGGQRRRGSFPEGCGG